MTKKESWKPSRIGLLVPMDSPIFRFLYPATSPMGIVSSTLVRSGVGTPAAQGGKRHGARSNRAILIKMS